MKIFQPRRARGITLAKSRRIARGFALGATFLGLAVYWLHPRILERIDTRISDVVFQIRQAPPPPDDIVIVSIDEKSIKEYGRWPWDRSLQGRLIHTLKRLGAGVIAQDIVYTTRQNEKEDRALIRSLKEPGAPVISGYFFREDQSVPTSMASVREVERSKIAAILRKTDARDDTVALYPFVESNHSLFSGSFAGFGFFNTIPDSDGLIRSAPLVFRFKGHYYPSLPIEALSKKLGQNIVLELDREGVASLRIGERVIPVNARGKLALNFYNGSPRIPIYPASDVLDHKIPARSISGKLVFVGVTELGIADVRPTPVDHSFPGVGIHATVAANILQEFYLYRDNRTVLIDLILMTLFPLAMVFVLFRVGRPMLMTIFFISVAASVWFIYYYTITRSGLLISLFYPLVSVLFSYIIFISYAIFISDTKTRYMRRALSSYVSPKFVNRLLLDPDSLNLLGEKRTISVLFSDIRGFTTISEGMAPEELVMMLNEYLGPMTDIVMSENGTLDKYIGDSVMALYNAPHDVADHANCAARTAIRMQKTLKELNQFFENKYSRKFGIGIGIHTGDAVVGNMGSNRRFNYTAMGDTVNLASRLEGRTKYYHVDIIISKSTHEGLGDEFLRRRLDRIRVKGKNLPVDIYQLFVDPEDQSARRLKELFEAALDHYLKGEFKVAGREFRNLLTEFPEDYPTILYIERCNRMVRKPPKTEWDGVFVMTEK